MKSNMCYLLDEQGRCDILDEVERTGKKCNLDKKQQLQLRLLAEELICFLQTIPSEYEAVFWLEKIDNEFELHLKTEILLGNDNGSKIMQYTAAESFDEVNGMVERLVDLFIVNVKNYVKTGKNYIDISEYDKNDNIDFSNIIYNQNISEHDRLISDILLACFTGMGSLNWSLERYRRRLEAVSIRKCYAYDTDDTGTNIKNDIITILKSEIKKSILAQLSDDLYAIIHKNKIEIIAKKQFM